MKFRISIAMPIIATIISPIINAQETRNFDVKGFEGVKNSTSAEVHISQSPGYSIEVTAKSAVFNEFEIIVKDNILHIKSKDNLRFTSNWGKVLVKVSCPEIKLLAQNGSGNMIALTPIKVADEFTASINGSGDILLKEILANSVQVSINGSGNIKTSSQGKTNSLKANSNGSGNVHLESLTTEIAQVKLNGSGDAIIRCGKEFKGSINGSGSITLYGNPLIDAKINGSGRLVSK
ncbi:MAG TPA: DUF2807 domain-containing protein [Bacteroidales bacterium]|nr:DUF2807 domain-containing protein [Bacteroidales bacterium]